MKKNKTISLILSCILFSTIQPAFNLKSIYPVAQKIYANKYGKGALTLCAVGGASYLAYKAYTAYLTLQKTLVEELKTQTEYTKKLYDPSVTHLTINFCTSQKVPDRVGISHSFSTKTENFPIIEQANTLQLMEIGTKGIILKCEKYLSKNEIDRQTINLEFLSERQREMGYMYNIFEDHEKWSKLLPPKDTSKENMLQGVSPLLIIIDKKPGSDRFITLALEKYRVKKDEKK